MKIILRLFALLLAGVLTFSVAGCGKKEVSNEKDTNSTASQEKDRILYNVDLSKYITVGKYTALEVDTASDEYKGYYESEIDSDIYYNSLYNTLKTGKVADGDTANIDYVGKKDGVAFQGGTANGYDLEIGSNSFIDGFEDGLIGVEIGSTVDLDLKFPENYDSEELAGAAVVFTVKVNSVQRKMEPKEYFSKLGFKSEDEYRDDVSKRAAKNHLIEQVKAIETKDYPKSDVELIQPYLLKQLDNMYQQQYGMTLENLLASTGQTKEDFMSMLNEQQLYPMMETQMALYYILDKEKLSVGKKETDAEIKKVLSYDSMKGAKESDIVDFYGRYYFEVLAVENAVKEYLYKNAVIK